MKRVLTVLGVLLMAASTVQTASAARHGRKPAHAFVTQQSRDARAYAPASSNTRSCDIIWCYQN
jgi:poly(3-hydroxybutyrate) depolymerase